MPSGPEPAPAPLDWDAFVAAVLPGGPPGSEVTPRTGLYDDLALDSFQAVEVVLRVEALAGRDDEDGAVPPLYTLGDLHGYYLALLA